MVYSVTGGLPSGQRYLHEAMSVVRPLGIGFLWSYD